MADFFEEYAGYPNYEKAAIHDEAHGKPVRKKLWMVFWIMLGVTLFELYLGSSVEMGELNKEYVFIFFTLVKAFFIVWIFMHLGDEKRALKYVIIAPYTLFIFYLAFMAITEGVYSHYVTGVGDPLFIMKAVLH